MTEEPRPINLSGWAERVSRHAGDAIPDVPPEMADLILDDAEHAHTNATRRWHAAVPRVHHGARLSQFEPAPWIAEAYAWAENPHGRNVLIGGPVGVGKSQLAAALIRDAVYDSLDGLLITAPALLDRLRPSTDDTDTLADLADLDRLVVDDLGTERLTDWGAERIGMLIHERWAAGLPTIYTTNLSRKALTAHIGPRAHSRMMDHAIVISLSGADRRHG